MQPSPSSAPKVSVIIAAYNQERFVGRCLRSLLNQRVPSNNYEVIVVNDGSEDNTTYALSLFTDPSASLIQVLNNNVNLGLPGALNVGIKASRGEYIVRVDSDDFVNSNFINFLAYYLDSNESTDAVACDYLLVDDEEVVLSRASSATDPIACGIMFRRKCLFDIGLYDESFLRHEERDLRIRFEARYHIDYLPLPLYRYRKHSTNITNDKTQMTAHYNKLVAKHGYDVKF